jgi:hypothetical protein
MMPDVAEREMSGAEGMAPADRTKLRVLLIGGSLVAALGDLALASGDFRRGTTSLVIGLAGVVLGVKRAQGLTAGAGDGTTSAYTAWYTAALGLVLMGAGAAITVPARDAETTTAEVIGFLAAGVLLWMGVTCLIAAVVKARRGDAPSRPPKGQRRNKPSPPPKAQRRTTASPPPKAEGGTKPSPPSKGRRGRSG